MQSKGANTCLFCLAFCSVWYFLPLMLMSIIEIIRPMKIWWRWRVQRWHHGSEIAQDGDFLSKICTRKQLSQVSRTIQRNLLLCQILEEVLRKVSQPVSYVPASWILCNTSPRVHQGEKFFTSKSIKPKKRSLTPLPQLRRIVPETICSAIENNLIPTKVLT